MSTIPILETERLIIRPLELDKHVPDIFKMYSDAEAMRFVPYLPHQSEAETQAHFEQKIKGGAVHWAVSMKHSEEVIGVVNYLGGTAIPGMGYMIRRDYWGQGIAAEAARPVLTYGFQVMELGKVELWIDSNNHASQRVADKLGFKVKGRIPLKYSHATEYMSMLVYGMRREDWLDEKMPLNAATRFFRAQTVLMTHDVAATTNFYRDQLGFTIDFLYGEPPTHAAVVRGDWTGSQVVLQITQVSSDQELGGGSYLYIFVDEKLDELHDTYRLNGVGIVQPPESYPWGMREFTVRDNNGYALRFGMHV